MFLRDWRKRVRELSCLRQFEILNPSRLAVRLCHAVSMKNKNKRELEKHWATEAAKKRKAAKKRGTTHREEVNQATAQVVREATDTK